MLGNTTNTAYGAATTQRNIAMYLRISQEDGADLESNSIKNQREIIISYLAERAEFNGANCIDYVEACDILEPTPETA